MKAFTCLLIDDDIDDHELFEDQVKKISSSLNLIKAFNGKEALDKLLKHIYEPDVIFLDLNMPIMNGKEFLKELKKEEDLKNIPVVILSTTSNKRSEKEMMELGAIFFMAKPYKVIDWEDGINGIFKKLFPGLN